MLRKDCTLPAIIASIASTISAAGAQNLFLPPSSRQRGGDGGGGGGGEDAASCLRDRECLQRRLDESSSSPEAKAQASDNVDVPNFYAWSVGKSSLLGALFPDLPRLREAWEVHPLLSKVSFGQPPSVPPLNAIPTFFHDRSSLQFVERDPTEDPTSDLFLSLFAVDDAPKVLEHINMHHGTEYQLVKTAMENPQSIMIQEYTLPGEHYEVSDITDNFHKEGMSLIVPEMERRWFPIARMTRRLEEEIGAVNVHAKLYMTSEVYMEEWDINRNGLVRQGLDAHWDSTDIIVVQLAGRKRWSVAREPIVHLSHRDAMRRPTQEEKEIYARKNRFMEYTTCPGDVLYIPRGHIHNASTIPFDTMKRRWLDWDSCPNYPKGLVEAESLASRIALPSVHLSFEVASEMTIESLLHFAIYDFSDDLMSVQRGVAIPANRCSSPHQREMSYDVTWEMVLHHSLAEVSRRPSDCDNAAFRGIPAKRRGKCNDTLRKFAPLSLLTNNEFDEGSLSVKRRVDKRIQTTSLKVSYYEAVEAFGSSAHLSRTIDFVAHILEQDLYFGHSSNAFDYPDFVKDREAILCPNELRQASEAYFSQILQDFVQFASGDVSRALLRMNDFGRQARIRSRRRQQTDLASVGQLEVPG